MQQTLNTTHRQLPLQACFNSRDLGGISNQAGRNIKTQLLLRADDLSSLSTADVVYLCELPLHTVIDFRSTLEQNHKPDIVPDSCQRHLHLDILSGNMEVYMQQMKDSSANARAIMFEIYSDLVLNPQSQQQYRQFFNVLQQEPQGSLLFHCSAGKDRTGIATALILEALGVERDCIMQVYLLSNPYLISKYSHLFEAYPHAYDFLTVSEDFLQHAWDLIDKQHGTVERYLTEVLHIDLPLMQNLYLEA